MSLQWWAYRHDNGTVHVRRFLAGPGTVASIDDAVASPFVVEVIAEPFDAPDQLAATEYARKRLTTSEQQATA